MTMRSETALSLTVNLQPQLLISAPIQLSGGKQTTMCSGLIARVVSKLGPHLLECVDVNSLDLVLA